MCDLANLGRLGYFDCGGDEVLEGLVQKKRSWPRMSELRAVLTASSLVQSVLMFVFEGLLVL